MWSTDVDCCGSVQELYRKGVFKYIELFVVPGSCQRCLGCWNFKNIPYVLHAPHSYAGLNFAEKCNESKNEKLVEEVELFRETLQPSWIIFHPGINGSIDETIRQINLFRKNYQKLFAISLIENKPKIGLNGELCVGASPDEIRKCILSTEIGFCLDIGHSIYYAKWAGLEYKGVVKSFDNLEPTLYHLSDGDVDSATDQHLNFGNGNFDLPWVIRVIPDHSSVTIETQRKIKNVFSDFLRDVKCFRKIEGGDVQ